MGSTADKASGLANEAIGKGQARHRLGGWIGEAQGKKGWLKNSKGASKGPWATRKRPSKAGRMRLPPPLMTSKARSENVRTGFGSKRARRRDAHMIIGIRPKGKSTRRKPRGKCKRAEGR